MSVITAVPVALDIVKAAFETWLDSLVGSRVYWLVAVEQAALPCIVVQSQDNGGQPDPFIGLIGWRGLIVVRCIAATESAANALGISAHAAIPPSALVSGYRITTELDRRLPIPPGRAGYVSARQYRVAVFGGS